MVDLKALPIRLLLERLLFPVPRVRWEAAFSLAELIRNGDREAASLLLDWIGARQLESEVVLGLGIVDAFDLAGSFEFSDFQRAIRAPSLLSDWILNRNFNDASDFREEKYECSPDDTAALPKVEEVWFHRFRKSVAHPALSRRFLTLQKTTRLPFLERWEHEWQWLQAIHCRPEPSFPEFFSRSDSGRAGWFELGQRELFVSAYLRTLAFAVENWCMPHHEASQHSILALSLVPGLAGLNAVERPEWTRNLLATDAEDAKNRVEELWSFAKAYIRYDEVPIALKVIDTDVNNFVEFDLVLAMGPSGFSAGTPQALESYWLYGCETRGEMAGPAYEQRAVDPSKISSPQLTVLRVLPSSPGSVETELAMHIRVASPSMFGTSSIIECDSSEIRLVHGREVLSRWIHWYADWEPVAFSDLRSSVGFITTVSKSRLDLVSASPNVEIARLANVRQGTRKNRHYPQEIQAEKFWF